MLSKDKLLVGALLVPGVMYALLTTILFSSAVADEETVVEEMPPPLEVAFPPLHLDPDPDPTLGLMEESDALSRAMCGFLQEMVSEEECRKRDLLGLADVLVKTVDERSRDGGWVPLGRRKAPAFLSAWSYYEVSWQWQNPPVGSSHGELGIFQMHGVARRFAPEDFTTNPYSAVEGAIAYMDYLRHEACGASGWARAYATGKCGEGNVDHRFELARRFLRDMER